MSEVSLEIVNYLEDEVRALESIIRSLEAQIEKFSLRHYEENQRSRDWTQALVAARREEDKAYIAHEEAISYQLRDGWRDELERLKEIRESPYFAKVVVEEREGQLKRIIEYRLGKIANSDCRIVDWKRSPIARLFYEYREGDEYSEVIQGREREGVVLERMKVRIERGTLAAVSCRHGDFVKLGSDWKRSHRVFSSVSQKVTRDALGDVLSLITPEQFAAITEHSGTAVMVKGVAGSGKTTVALHRLVWLRENGGASSGRRAAVFVKSAGLKSYIENSLHLLGVSDIPVCIFSDWLEKKVREVPLLFGVKDDRDAILKTATGKDPLKSRFLKSAAIMKRIVVYVQGQVARFQNLLAPYSSVAEPYAKPLEKCLNELKTGNVALCRALPRLRELCAASRFPEDLENVLQKVARRLSLYIDDLLLILSQPELLIREAQTSLLDPRTIAEAKDCLELSKSREVIDPDFYCALFYLYLLKNFRVGSKEARNEDALFDYLVVDEVQDFSALELGVLLRVVSGFERVTLVGDVAQATDAESTFPGWESLRRICFSELESSQLLTLSVSQRMTLPLVRFSEYICKRSADTTEGRAGRRPICYICPNEEMGVREVTGWITRVLDTFPGTLLAVLVASAEESRFAYSLLKPSFGEAIRSGADSVSFEEGVIVVHVGQVKGLEFPHVLIWNPSARSYPGTDEGQNALYIAATRAQELMALVLWHRPSPCLPPAQSKLWRVKYREQEAEDEEG